MNFNVDFLLCHGSNNRFILIDELKLNSKLDDAQRIKISCIIGQFKDDYKVDGTLFYSENYPLQEQADCTMRMFNLDGTEAEMCGNGLRCAGRYAIDKLGQNKVTIATPINCLTVEEKPLFENVRGFSSQIGPAKMGISSMKLQPEQIIEKNEDFYNQPLAILEDKLGDIRYSALTIPNPHLVALKEKPVTKEKLVESWYCINDSGLFPDGINFSVVSKIPSELKNQMLVMTCERGVGATDACGTAMCASAIIAKKQGWFDQAEVVEIYNLGGFVYADVVSDYPTVLLTGNATWVCAGQLTLNLQSMSFQIKLETQFFEEVNAYKTIADYSKNIVTQFKKSLS